MSKKHIGTFGKIILTKSSKIFMKIENFHEDPKIFNFCLGAEFSVCTTLCHISIDFSMQF